jgi:hypothetical protein
MADLVKVYSNRQPAITVIAISTIHHSNGQPLVIRLTTGDQTYVIITE